MTSTLLDVTVCLLLVGVAVGTVTGAFPSPVADPATTDRADRVASVLATATTNVSYRTAGETRRSHGTLAGLLARATVLSTAGTHDPFVDAVRARVTAVLPPRTQVVARWEPTPASPVRGEFTVGDTPQSDDSIHTATLSIPSGIQAADRSTSDPSTDNEEHERAAVLASHVVRGLFPPRETRLAFRECGPDAVLVGRRYAAVADAVDADVMVSAAKSGATAAGSEGGQWCDRFDVEGTNRALRSALAEAYVEEFEASDDVATRPERVRIVVRWWS